jgi:putative ABC transport system ATP-binding protein
VLDILQELCRKNGTTVVMVTHDPRASERAGRVLHLDKGVLVEAGTLGPTVPPAAPTA